MRERVLQTLKLVHPTPATGQLRRDFLAGMATRRGPVPPAVYDELVNLPDRVRGLERQVTELGGSPASE